MMVCAWLRAIVVVIVTLVIHRHSHHHVEIKRSRYSAYTAKICEFPCQSSHESRLFVTLIYAFLSLTVFRWTGNGDSFLISHTQRGGQDTRIAERALLEKLPVHVQPLCCMFAFGLLDETFDVANPTLRSVPVSRSAAPCAVTVSARGCCHGARSAGGSVSTASAQLVARRTSICSLDSSLTRRTKDCIPLSLLPPGSHDFFVVVALDKVCLDLRFT